MKTQRKPKTHQQVVDECNELARSLYRLLGYQTNGGFKFYKGFSTRQLLVWHMAVEAYEHIEGTDVRSALAETEGES